MNNFLLLSSQIQKNQIDIDPVAILISLLSGLIGSVITIAYTRFDAKKKLIVDISMQQLLPNVYLPILKEYQKVIDSEIQGNGLTPLKTSAIEAVIYENVVILQLSPKKIKNKINEIYGICKSINDTDSYQQKVPRIKTCLSELKKEVDKEFEGYFK